MILRLLRHPTLQRSIRECRQYSPTCKRYAHRPFSGNIVLRKLSSSASNTTTSGTADGMLIAAGVGILGAACLFGYYATNTQYTPEIPKEDSSDSATEEVGAGTPESRLPAVAVKITLPESVPYVIIGAGTAGHAACRAIRKADPAAKILVIGEENAMPYMRPPLSKELWFTDSPNVSDNLVFKSWNGKERSVFFEENDYYTNIDDIESSEDGGVAVVSGRTVSSIDAGAHEIALSSGETVQYGKLLIATGGTPKSHKAFQDAGDDVLKRTTLFRNIADFQRLNKAVGTSKHVVVVGGGFLGSELSCALATRGKSSGLKVTQVYQEEGNMAKVLPKYLSDWTTAKVTKEGVNIISNSSVEKVKYEKGKLNVELNNGDSTTADHVVVCVGLKPNVELAPSAGLELDPQEGGFRVNSELEARSDIWVAGDAACFYDINLGRRRVEHHDHAVVSGRLAGENMTGAKKSYKHQSMFWSDLGPDVGYEAIGIVDSSLSTVGVWAKATESDTPKAAEEASGESIRSDSESSVDESSTEKVVTKETTAAAITSQSSDQDESFGKGVVFYMREKKVVGILLWNIFSQMPIARKIISEAKEHEDMNAVAKMFKIH